MNYYIQFWKLLYLMKEIQIMKGLLDSLDLGHTAYYNWENWERLNQILHGAEMKITQKTRLLDREPWFLLNA